MGLHEFFNQTVSGIRKHAGAFASGFNYLDQHIGQPLGNFLKQVPLIGDVVRSFDPLMETVRKGANAAGQFSRGESMSNLPTLSEAANGLKHARQGFQHGMAGASTAMKRVRTQF